jgi:hypothetical protein
MSHFTKVKTKLTNLEHLAKAFQRLGYEVQQGNFKVTEYGQTSDAQLLLDKALGLSLQEDGTYAFVGDPYHGSTQKIRQHYRQLEKFTAEVSTAYAIEETIDALQQQNYYCTDNTEASVGADGMITMTFESYS